MNTKQPVKHIRLILHKLSGSQDHYGTITHDLTIPEHYTYIDLAEHIVSEGLLDPESGLPNYLMRDQNFVYDFFEDYRDSAVVTELDAPILDGARIIFSPNYYNYPKDPCLTLNYVYIRKDMRNMRWKKHTEHIRTRGLSDLTKEVDLLMTRGDFTDKIADPELGAPCWSKWY